MAEIVVQPRFDAGTIGDKCWLQQIVAAHQGLAIQGKSPRNRAIRKLGLDWWNDGLNPKSPNLG